MSTANENSSPVLKGKGSRVNALKKRLLSWQNNHPARVVEARKDKVSFDLSI